MIGMPTNQAPGFIIQTVRMANIIIQFHQGIFARSFHASQIRMSMTPNGSTPKIPWETLPVSYQDNSNTIAHVKRNVAIMPNRVREVRRDQKRTNNLPSESTLLPSYLRERLLSRCTGCIKTSGLTSGRTLPAGSFFTFVPKSAS